MEAVEAVEVIETAEVLRPRKSLLRTSVIQVLEFKKFFFDVLKKQI